MQLPRDRRTLWSLLLLLLQLRVVHYKGSMSSVEPVAVLFQPVRIVQLCLLAYRMVVLHVEEVDEILLALHFHLKVRIRRGRLCYIFKDIFIGDAQELE